MLNELQAFLRIFPFIVSLNKSLKAPETSSERVTKPYVMQLDTKRRGDKLVVLELINPTI